VNRLNPSKAYALALTLLIVGLVLAVLAYGLPWLTLAVALGIIATRGVGRVIASGLLVLAGVGAVLAGGIALADGDSTPAVLGLVGGLLISAASVWSIVRGRTWPAMGGRYDRSGTASSPRTGRLAAWDALDRGQDPTDDLPGRQTDDSTGGDR
jgi:hypothetical protein